MIYRLTQLLAATRGGINNVVDAEVRGIAKTNDEGPFTIANEIVSARLGQALGLPIPAGVLAEDGSGKLYYFSLDVSKTGHTLPPIIGTDFVNSEPRLASGCAVFDFWVANADRHSRNLSRDPAFNPPRVSIFDHGHALLGTNPPVGRDRLAAAVDEAGCLGTGPLPGNRQALLDHLTDDAALLGWVERVEAIPDFIIRDACSGIAGPTLNVDQALATELADWLIARKLGIRTLISDNSDQFPQVNQWGMLWRRP